MQVYTQVSDLPPDSRGRFITVGAFDGVHRGHQALLQRLRQLAREHSVHACVLTFEPHPQIILGKQPPLGILTTLSEKLEHISQIGINETIVLPFTTELARTDAETFVRHYLVEQLHIYGILVGHDHMFGRKRQGNAELLRRIGTEVGFIVEHFPPVTVGGIVVSSSAIRRALREGDVETAAKLLGRPYSLCGTVVHGDGRGRILGFPTANIVPEDPRKVLPAYGVY
ncbi:MAG: riboflavin biosynthesis protein RibF, partial [Candidatus Kapabacteria bacterium]|nr:riboflavin biosynthesis protein RibF [Candidatus Kapabacteria bacterium]